MVMKELDLLRKSNSLLRCLVLLFLLVLGVLSFSLYLRVYI
jgi:hypothetical protein